jgi:hypothetical protein
MLQSCTTLSVGQNSGVFEGDAYPAPSALHLKSMANSVREEVLQQRECTNNLSKACPSAQACRHQ